MIVAHVITRLIRGGAEENTVLTCNWFATKRDTVFIIHGDEWDEEMGHELTPRVTRIQVPALCRAISPARDVQAVIQIRLLLRRIRPEIVHTHESKAGVVGRLAAAGLPGCAVIHGIHILPFMDVGRVRGLVYRAMERAVAPLTDQFISVSEPLRSIAIASGLGSPEQHHLIASGMDIRRFQMALPTAPRSPEEPLRALYLANYEPRKRHLDLMEMLAQRRIEFESCMQFRFAGRGHLLAECQRLAKERQLLHFVSVEGFATHAEQAVADADIGIYCSAHEGLPRAIVQYCAAGKPIVAMSLPGLGALVRNEETGIVVPPGNFNALGDALVRLAGDGDLRARLSRKARELDLSPWSVERMCTAIADVYNSALRNVATDRHPAEPFLAS